MNLVVECRISRICTLVSTKIGRQAKRLNEKNITENENSTLRHRSSQLSVPIVATLSASQPAKATDVKFKTDMTFFGIFKKIAGIWNMVLIKILSYLLDIENSKISSTFDVDIWNQNNPDFYVPPHPILYLLTFNVPYFIIIRFVTF